MDRTLLTQALIKFLAGIIFGVSASRIIYLLAGLASYGRAVCADVVQREIRGDIYTRCGTGRC